MKCDKAFVPPLHTYTSIRHILFVCRCAFHCISSQPVSNSVTYLRFLVPDPLEKFCKMLTENMTDSYLKSRSEKPRVKYDVSNWEVHHSMLTFYVCKYIIVRLWHCGESRYVDSFWLTEKVGLLDTFCSCSQSQLRCENLTSLWDKRTNVNWRQSPSIDGDDDRYVRQWVYSRLCRTRKFPETSSAQLTLPFLMLVTMVTVIHNLSGYNSVKKWIQKGPLRPAEVPRVGCGSDRLQGLHKIFKIRLECSFESLEMYEFNDWGVFDKQGVALTGRNSTGPPWSVTVKL